MKSKKSSKCRTMKVWLNVYRVRDGLIVCGYTKRASADDEAVTTARLACIEREISYDLGEGL